MVHSHIVPKHSNLQTKVLTLGLKAMSLRIISTVKTPVKTILRMSMA